MAHRHDVTRTDEEMGLAELEIAVHSGVGGVGGELRRAQDDEQGVAVAFELRPLVRSMGVLDREVVQLEGGLNLVEERLVGLVETEPDEDRRIRERRRDLVQGEGRDPHAVPIGGAVDDARRSRWLFHRHSLRPAIGDRQAPRAPDVVVSRLFHPNADPMSSLSPGTRLGPYEILAELGEGGMGEVYRATDSRLKREVAIKVLPAAFTADKERLARFEREAQLLAQLNHPNIARSTASRTGGVTHALVMELVAGPTLAERLESGAFSITKSLSIALQIAEALEEAHEKGIVHRDLKPQNVKASGEGKVKVLDFGLAKAMDSSAPRPRPPISRARRRW